MAPSKGAESNRKAKTVALSAGLFLIALLGTIPSANAGTMVKCDEAAGFGQEEVGCSIVCTPGDTVTATVETSNPDDIRTLEVGLDCGNAWDENSCDDVPSCSASDDFSDDEDAPMKGNCWGSGDEDWNDYYELTLWCGSSGGEATWLARLLQSQRAAGTPFTCQAVEAAAAAVGMADGSFVIATAVVVGSLPVASGVAWNDGQCASISPAVSLSGTVLTIVA